MTYLGPYAECKTEKINVATKRKTCTNRVCPNSGKEYYNATYCDKCGSIISETTVMVLSNKVNTWAVRGEMKEALTPPPGDSFYYWMNTNDINIWLPNHRRKDKTARPFSFDDRHFRYYAINGDIIKAEIDEFQKQYKDELNILQEWYGNVIVLWGLLEE